MNGISALIVRDTREVIFSPPISEIIAGKCPSANQEASSHQEVNLMAP